MRLNITVALTFILLSLMCGAGMASGLWGFSLGREALKSINQLDISPTSQIVKRKQKSSNRVPVTILEEKDILANVKAHIEGKLKEQKAQKNQNQSYWQNRKAAIEYAGAIAPRSRFSMASQARPVRRRTTRAGFLMASQARPVRRKTTRAGFPMASQDRGVTLEVLSAHRQGRNLRLDVNLRNEGNSTVRFLYSFLGVTDDRGRAISATANGLPGKLPANRQTFSGTVSVPVALLDNSAELSLQLTDYPHRKLDLQLSGIPVVR